MGFLFVGVIGIVPLVLFREGMAGNKTLFMITMVRITPGLIAHARREAVWSALSWAGCCPCLAGVWHGERSSFRSGRPSLGKRLRCERCSHSQTGHLDEFERVSVRRIVSKGRLLGSPQVGYGLSDGRLDRKQPLPLLVGSSQDRADCLYHLETVTPITSARRESIFLQKQLRMSFLDLLESTDSRDTSGGDAEDRRGRPAKAAGQTAALGTVMPDDLRYPIRVQVKLPTYVTTMDLPNNTCFTKLLIGHTVTN